MIGVDADACPVRAEGARVATRHGLRLFVVSDGGIRPSAKPPVGTATVADGPDPAAIRIAGRAGPGDVVVTGDIPLAAKAIAGGAPVARRIGELPGARIIGAVLAARGPMAGLRAADPSRARRGRPFAAADRPRFRDALGRAMRAAMSQRG
jgi:uncharacterized protein YaiI (UPF0178 family)